MAKSVFPNILRERVMQRALHCCEYCKSQDKFSPNAFTVDHIVPKSFGGTDDFDNLSYACFLCNRLKSNKLKVFDQVSEKWIPIFNPRIDFWTAHFSWGEDTTEIIGVTPIGRSTVISLRLNREKLVEYRKCLIPFGGHPPQ